MSGFAFVRPSTIEDAIDILSGDEGARPMAGGATLVAMMNAGLAEPSTVVALDGIPELQGISVAEDGSIRIGAMTKHRETASDQRLKGTIAVVREAAGVIANPVVRNMGTMGGSVSFADPAADYPPALVAAGAVMEVAGREGRRRVPANEFFMDWYMTALEPGEVVVAIHLPPPRKGTSLYRKVARVSGDYATASCALVLDRSTDRPVVRVAVGACGPVPVRDEEAEVRLAEKLPDPAAIKEFGAALAAAADPVDDVRGTAEHRLRLIPRIVAAAIAEAGAVGEFA